MTTLSGAIEQLAGQGYTEHFQVSGNKLRALHSKKEFAANELVIRGYERVEGVSDPGDMAIVFAIESRNGTRGTLVDAFGVYSNPAISAFLDNIPIRRSASL